MIPKFKRVLTLGVALGGLAVTGSAVAVVPSTTVAAPATTSTASDCATDDHHRVRAGSSRPDPNQVSRAEVAAAGNALASRQRRLPNVTKAKITNPSSKIVIPVWVHVITKDDRSATNQDTGWVPTTRITNQMAVLNSAFASSGFEFEFAETPRSSGNQPWYNTRKNNDWYSWGDDDDAPAKSALHRGRTDALNMYFTAFTDTDLLGYATFPFENAGAQDGVVMLNNTLPGGRTTNYNLGDTVVHEVGHWLGLFHTFQDDCSYVNDAVKDTPAQKFGRNVFGCNTRDNTCPSPGTDPVRNYMSYGDDNCLTNFTAGQGYRMRSLWYTYRAPQV